MGSIDGVIDWVRGSFSLSSFTITITITSIKRQCIVMFECLECDWGLNVMHGRRFLSFFGSKCLLLVLPTYNVYMWVYEIRECPGLCLGIMYYVFFF